jgi:hypothetical protein
LTQLQRDQLANPSRRLQAVVDQLAQQWEHAFGIGDSVRTSAHAQQSPGSSSSDADERRRMRQLCAFVGGILGVDKQWSRLDAPVHQPVGSKLKELLQLLCRHVTKQHMSTVLAGLLGFQQEQRPALLQGGSLDARSRYKQQSLLS